MSDRWERLVDAASSRAALAATAVADLAARFGDEALGLASRGAERALPTVADVVGPYADEALVLASLGAGRGLPAVTAWAVFVVGYLRFSPRLYPTLDGDPSEEPSFRAVVAAVALAFALVFAAAARATTARFAATLAVGVAVLLSGSLAFVAYFRLVVGWDLLDPGEEVFAPLSGFFGGALRADVERDLRRPGWRGTVGAAVWVVAFGTFFAVPTMLVGVLTAVLRLLGPLPDLLVLAYVVAGPLLYRLPGPVREFAAVAKESEDRLYRSATHAGLLEGAALGLLVALGAFVAAAVVWVAVGSTAGVASLVALAVPASPLVAWNWLGRLAVLYAAGGYGLWFWQRVARRLPAHLDRRRDDGVPESDAGPAVAAPPVARPRWLTVPPVVAVLAVVASLVAPQPGPAAFAAWPLLVAALAWLVADARRRDREATRTDDAVEPVATVGSPLDEADAIALAVAIQLVGVWTAGAARFGGTRVGGLAAQLVLVGLVWGLVRASRTGDRSDREGGGYAVPALVVAAGVALVALTPFAGSTPALAAVGGGLVVAGAVLGAVRYVEG